MAVLRSPLAFWCWHGVANRGWCDSATSHCSAIAPREMFQGQESRHLTFSLDFMWVADDSRLRHCHVVILEESRAGVWLNAFGRLAATWELPWPTWLLQSTETWRDKEGPHMASALFLPCLSRSVCKHKPLALAALGLHLLDPVLCLQVAPPGPTIFTGPWMLLLNVPSCHFGIHPLTASTLSGFIPHLLQRARREGRGWETVPTGRLWVQHCTLLLQQHCISVWVFQRCFPEHHQCAFAAPSDGFTSHLHLLPQHPLPPRCPAGAR